MGLSPNPAAVCRLASGLLLLLALAILPYAALADTGFADVLSSVYVDERKPGCSTLHQGKDYIYLTTGAANTSTNAWTEVASGPGLADKYKIQTGDQIRIRYKNTTTPNRRLMADPAPEMDGIDIVSESEGHEIYTGSQIRVRSMIYLITTCGWPAAATVQDITNVYFNNTSSISGYHDTCSYGKVAYDPSENIVFGPVDIPCSGTVANGATTLSYDSNTSCGANEQFAWKSAVEAAARAAGYGPFMDSAPRRRIVHILPSQVKCGWAGLGSVGCSSSTCVVYIKGNYAKSLTVNMHELGHTQGLSHTGRGLDEYGDTSDVMGTATAEGYLCMNVGNQYRVGWNKPVATLYPNNTNNAGNTGVNGRWVLPPAFTNDTNHLLLQYAGNGTVVPKLFVSFRARGTKYDNALSSTNSNKVFVHQFNGTAKERDYNRTLLVATLGAGGVYTSPFLDRNNDQNVGGGVRLTVLNITNGVSASVQLCRFTQLVETACDDGIDNDCNGLVDMADQACSNPPSSPPHLPPPSQPNLPPPDMP